MKQNLFEEKDFLNKNKTLKFKTIGLYLKYKLLSKINFSPTKGKIIFTKKFPNIKIDKKIILTYIETKFRKKNVLNKGKLPNYKTIVNIIDDEGIQLQN